MKEKYIEECKIISQNCNYTAEAHHNMAAVEKNKSIWLEIVPAICAALTSTLVAAGLAKTQLLLLTIISAVISAVSGVLNPGRSHQAQLTAAKNFTTLEHDARFLWEAEANSMSDDAFALSVRQLHERYNELVKTSPTTNKESFNKGRETIQTGIHNPDRDEAGNIKG
ncbi:MAG: hypothetical protein JWQ09_997 [Segetibacter sp.]|nr:hypothetical protein [Segetibacter sp.]